MHYMAYNRGVWVEGPIRQCKRVFIIFKATRKKHTLLAKENLKCLSVAAYQT